MSLVFFGADLHIGHKNIPKYRKNFETAEQHDEYMLDMINDKINKRTIIYLLGDICFTDDAIQKLARLNTYKNIRIVLGNHDVERGINITNWVNAGFHRIYALLSYKEFWLSHAPLHSTELRGKINIHGHNHFAVVPDARYRCVSMEQTNYNLITLDEIREEFRGIER